MLVLIFLLPGCMGIVQENNTSIKITDALEREVLFEKAPEKIVVAGMQTPMLVNFLYLFETAPEKIFAIENRSQSGINFLNQIDTEIENKYILEKGAGAEQIAPLNPDVVILKTSMKDTIGKQMEAIDIPIIYVSFESIDEIYRDIGILGLALNEQERAEEIVENYITLYQSIKSAISLDGSKLLDTVLLIQAKDENQKYAFSVPSGNWLQTTLVEEAGALPVWKTGEFINGWAEINFEQIGVWNPDHIFIINYQGKGEEIAESLANDKLWMQLDAVRESKLKSFPFDFISWDQPDPRWILGFRWIAEQVHPEAVFKTDFNEQILMFYSTYYGIQTDEMQEEITRMLD